MNQVANEDVHNALKSVNLTKLHGSPGYWCNKLHEWSENQKKKGLLDVKYDLSPGDRDIEEVAKELYEVLSGQLDYVDITNKDL